MAAILNSNGIDPFYYGGKLERICDPLDESLKNSSRKQKALKRTDSSRTKDSGFNSEGPSSVTEPPPFSEFSCGPLDNYEVCEKNEKTNVEHQEEKRTVIPNEDQLSVPVNSSNAKRKRKSTEDTKQATIKQHYYPEGGWGYVVVVVATLVQILTHGLQLSFGFFILILSQRWGNHVSPFELELLGSLCLSVSLIISPITIAVSRRKSIRLTAVIGGLVFTLGILFTSFATKFHQLYFSYGSMTGIGVGMTRDTATLMIGQYFKRRREVMEIFFVGSSGLGITIISILLRDLTRKLGWRFGLQALTGILFVTFLLGTFYRSASLYHPQRRAILHLKTQKRKIKNKIQPPNEPRQKLQTHQLYQDEHSPLFDFTTLKSRTVQIILLSTGTASFGLLAPLFLLARQAQHENVSSDLILQLQIYVGLSWSIGCFGFGIIVVGNSTECRISRQYLCQSSLLMVSLSVLSLTVIRGYNAYVIFVWIYGAFLGGYSYSAKMYIYEKVRARNFASAWGFWQFVTGVANMMGVPIIGYLNTVGSHAGYFMSGFSVLLGAMLLVLVDVHKNRLRRKRNLFHNRSNALASLEISSSNRKNSKMDNEVDENDDNDEMNVDEGSFCDEFNVDLEDKEVEVNDENDDHEDNEDSDLLPVDLIKVNFLEDERITSCNKVENVVILSELEQNLIAKSMNNVTTSPERFRKRPITVIHEEEIAF